MHFWIDKRSQTCGFGRARVAASLAGSGVSFGHHPRRIGGKSMVTPIHRYPAVDCRPHVHRHQQNQLHQQQQQQQQQLQQQQLQLQLQQQQQHHQQQQQQHFQQHQQNSYSQHNQHRTQQHNNQPQLQPECHVPLGQYGPSHSLELEQGTLGVGPAAIPVRQPNQPEAQLLPSHLKCGMWASLALATVFIAVFQGTGLEVLIFCAFSATFFLAACTVSLCRRPRDILITPPAHGAIEHAPVARLIEPQNMPQNTIEIENSTEIVITAAAAPPPPYHIAILLPENSKEADESPPPSYDKLVI